MDKILLIDTTDFIACTKETVVSKLQEDAYVSQEMNSLGRPAFLGSFYNWVFRHALEKIYHFTISKDFENPWFENCYNQIEPEIGMFFADNLDSASMLSLATAPRIQLAFNGRLLFIMPCHDIL